jgi:flagellar biosynthetic protein FlhB
MGRGMIAEKIIKLADESKVTIFQSPLLARALYFTGEIGKEISENLYSAVASVLAYIFKIERGEKLIILILKYRMKWRLMNMVKN